MRILIVRDQRDADIRMVERFKPSILILRSLSSLSSFRVEA